MSGDTNLASAILTALPSLLIPTLRQSTPLIFAGMGGLLSERVGVINIALEGLMLTGAFTGMYAGQIWGPATGLLAAVLSGVLVAGLHFVLTHRFKVNHIISGVAINLLAVNLTTFLLRRLFNSAIPRREAKVEHLLSPALFIVAALLLPFIIHFVLYKTAIGLRMRSVGESPLSAKMAGLSPLRIRLTGVAISGILAGIGGGYMAISQFGRFSDDMISGRGFIALAAVICGKWTPIGAAAAAIAFGFFDALQVQLQGTVQLPGELLRSLPYLFTIVAAVMLKPRPPAALGQEIE